MRKPKYKTNRRTHRETPKVRGSPQTRGYVHQSVASCKLFSKRPFTIQDNSVACTSLVYIARTPHRVFFYSYHWFQWTSFCQIIKTHHSLYNYVQTSGQSQSFIIKTKHSLYIYAQYHEISMIINSKQIAILFILLKTIPGLCLLSLRHINSETKHSLRFILNKTNHSLYD